MCYGTCVMLRYIYRDFMIFNSFKIILIISYSSLNMIQTNNKQMS